MANSTTAGSVAPMSLVVSPGLKQIRRVRVERSKADITNASVRVHLYGASPTVANGDNGAISSTQSGWLGSVDVTIGQLFSNGGSGVATTEINCATAGTLYALLEARAAVAPASAEVFTVHIETAD
jgi:hypothetical protein